MPDEEEYSERSDEDVLQQDEFDPERDLPEDDPDEVEDD